MNDYYFIDAVTGELILSIARDSLEEACKDFAGEFRINPLLLEQVGQIVIVRDGDD